MTSSGRLPSRCMLGHSARSAMPLVLRCTGKGGTDGDTALQTPPPSDGLPVIVRAKPWENTERKRKKFLAALNIPVSPKGRLWGSCRVRDDRPVEDCLLTSVRATPITHHRLGLGFGGSGQICLKTSHGGLALSGSPPSGDETHRPQETPL